MTDSPEPAGEPLEVLLDYLKRNRGFDFTGYKRSSLERRIQKRMESVEVGTYLDYLDYLEVHPDEFSFLFNTILINVTAFLRDPQAWEYMTETVIPQLLAEKPDSERIRVWCAGSASGEETYTIAMLLAKALGDAAFTERVKIYATDVDEEALEHARAGIFSAKDLEPLPVGLRERYFDRVDQRYAFRKDLRRAIIFGRNDLVQDAPISRVDLLLCRNTLMYFNAETQARILRRFHFALNPTGFLFLGKSEMLITHSDLFTPVNLKRRVFEKVAKATLRDRLAFAVPNGAENGDPPDDALLDSAFDAAPVAQVAVDHHGKLMQVNRAARALLSVGSADIGRPLKDLELSYRPVELRGHLDQVIAERRSITLQPVLYKTARGEDVQLEVALAPLTSGDAVVGASIAFVDLTEQRSIQDELERSKHELGTAYEELQSTVEELETTNEELQSTNEELETTNEELQSTNEELETMNEELQSSNEELETMNEELRQRSLELNEVNAFMETILTSMGVGVIVVDKQQRVQIWNRHAELMWGLRADEVEGDHLLGLDIGLPVERLKTPVRQVLAADAEREELDVDATDRRGRAFSCRVTVLPLKMPQGEPTGAIVLAERLAQDGADPSAQ